MAASSSPALEQAAQLTSVPGVYLVPVVALDPDARVHFIDGRAITAFAQHPAADDLIYVTTSHPGLLGFLGMPVVEVDP